MSSELFASIFDDPFHDVFLSPESHAQSYKSRTPYPHAQFDGVFRKGFLRQVAAEFPDLQAAANVRKYDTANERKIASKGEIQFGPTSLSLMHFLNSLPFLRFLEQLTGIKHLLPDPMFHGGGFHEIKPGGFLKIHADFNVHQIYGLDRRLNVLVYLNEDWEAEYGGHFELWSRDMQECKEKILPLFNRMVVFSTTSDSYHGHPDPLTCPPDRSRRSLALYYYTNGRPEEEVTEAAGTLFRDRPGIDATPSTFHRVKRTAGAIARDVLPPFITRMLRS